MIRFLNSQPLLLPAAALALSILFIDLSGTILFLIAALALITIILARKVSVRSFWLTLLCALAGVLLHANELRNLEQLKPLAGTEITILAIVENEPRDVRDYRQEVIVKIAQAPNNNLTGIRLLASIPKDTQLKVGEKIWLKGHLHLPRTPMNPQVLDKAKLLHRKGISLEIYVDRDQQTHHIARSHSIQAWAQNSRQWIRHQLTKGVADEDAKKIILAMFLGEKPRNGSEIMNAFKYSGTIHVFAVSGLHVMMIGLLFTLLFRVVGLPLKIWIPLVITIMFFYAIITGMNPPAMRAAIMGSTVLCALLLARKPSLPNSLWLSAIIAMFWSTHCIFLPGFQLSYAVLISICLTGSWWANRWKWLTKVDPFFPRSLFTRKQKALYQLRHKSASTLSVSSSAWFGSSFLIWLYFGLITPIAILASLPIMLMVFCLLSLCCLSLTLGSLSDHIAKPINQFSGFFANTTHSITRFFSSAESLRYHDKPWSQGERIVIYSLPEGGAANYLCIGGGTMLDAGSGDHFYAEIWPSLRKNGARLDSLIASHPDVSHIAGLSSVIENFPIRQIIISDSNKRSSAHQKLITQASEQHIATIIPTRKSYPLTEKSRIEILDTGSPTYPLADDRCAIYLLYWKDKKILFYNDAGGKSERRMRKRYPDLTADIIVIGKHSQDQSLSIDTIKSLKASHVVATQAPYPSGEMRSPQWIEQIQLAGIELLLLDQTGGIIMTQENGKLDIQTTIPHP